MESYIKTNYSGIVHDTKTRAIINTNDLEYNKILQQRKQNKQFQNLQSDLDSLRQEIVDIKEMLNELLSGKT